MKRKRYFRVRERKGEEEIERKVKRTEKFGIKENKRNSQGLTVIPNETVLQKTMQHGRKIFLSTDMKCIR